MPLTQDDLKNLSPEQLMELQKSNCVFCQIATGKIPAKTVFEDDKCVAVLDISPANLGHMLLFPKEHYSVLPQVTDTLIGHLFRVAKKLSQSALKAFQIRGTTIFVANAVAAGQKAPHVLIHIIPRAFDDEIDLSLPQNVSAKEQKEVRAMIKRFIDKYATKEILAEVVKKPKAAKEKVAKKETKKKGSTPSLDDISELFR